MNIRPGGAMVPGSSPLRRSVLIPIVTKWRQLAHRSLLWPMIVSVAFVVGMMVASEKPVASLLIIPDPATQARPYLDLLGWKLYFDQPMWVSPLMLLVGLYITLAIYYVIYLLCRRRKPVWILLAAAASTAVLFFVKPLWAVLDWLFMAVLANGVPSREQLSQLPFLTLFYKMFFAAGMREELAKALPVFAAWRLANRLKSPAKERLGVCDPLDGILLGAASAAAFGFIETYAEYVGPGIFDIARSISGTIAIGRNVVSAAGFAGLIGSALYWKLLLLRLFDQGFGHMAYTGYFGYFIGLAALRPKRRWQILAVGYPSAALLHALWNSSAGHLVWQLIIGAASYLFLAAAILKARELSVSPLHTPSHPLLDWRSSPPGAVAPQAQVHAPPIGAAANGAVRQGAQPGPAVAPVAAVRAVWLVFGQAGIELAAGTKVLEQQIPGLRAQYADGIIAEVRRHPSDASVIGLTNLSTTPWGTTSPRGNTRSVKAGESVVLAPGTRIDFGREKGEVSSTPPAPAAPPALGPARDLRIGSQQYALAPDAKLLESQIPGLKALFANGVVAIVSRNRQDPSALELKNVSASVWEVLCPGSQRQRISSGETVALISGTKIHFGSVDAELA